MSTEPLTPTPAAKAPPPVARVTKHGVFYAIELHIQLATGTVSTLLLKSENPSTKAIQAAMAAKQAIPPDVAKYFALWICGESLELQIRPSIGMLVEPMTLGFRLNDHTE